MVRAIFTLMTRRSAIKVGLATALPAVGAETLAFKMPEDACDCHTHIIGDPRKFPFFTGRTYTPEVASPAELGALHGKLRIQRVVIVTPSVYGTDNSATLWGMKALGSRARGVAVIDDKTSAEELAMMDRAGIRGIRLNLNSGGQSNPIDARERFAEAVKRIAPLGWHLQMYASLPVISRIKDLVEAAAVPRRVRSFCRRASSTWIDAARVQRRSRLVRSGHAYVKISGAYRASSQPPDYPDVAPFAKALIAVTPDRVLWGTDWPHPNTSTGARLPIDDFRLLNQLAVWAPDPSTRSKILVENPARLYGF